MFWDILVDPETGEEFVFDGVVEDGFWIDGVLRSRVSNAEYPVIDGVVVFVRGVDTGWRDEDIEALRRGEWIKRNWEDHMSKVGKENLWNEFCREIASSNGLILDVASGTRRRVRSVHTLLQR